MVPENKKEVCTTIVNTFDNLTLFILALTFQCGYKDASTLLEIVNMIGSIIVIIYFICAPESPYFLLTNGRKKEAI